MFNMKKIAITVFIVLGVVSLTGCGKQENYKATKSGLELQSIQSKNLKQPIILHLPQPCLYSKIEGM